MSIQLQYEDGGLYGGKIVEQALVETKNKGTLALKVGVIVTHQIDANGERHELSQQLRQDSYLFMGSDEATARAFRTVKEWGYPNEDLIGLDPEDGDLFYSFRGRDVELRHKLSTSEDGKRTFHNWDIQSGDTKVQDRTRLARYNRMLRKTNDNGADAAKSEVLTGAGAPITDDDVPF
jgi:hypothetical protein